MREENGRSAPARRRGLGRSAWLAGPRWREMDHGPAAVVALAPEPADETCPNVVARRSQEQDPARANHVAVVTP
jgi:hypothetical protein